MDSAYCTAAQRGQAEFTEKRSRFLGFCSPARTEAEALGFLEEIRAAHRTATHNVWAFSLRENSLCRYSDDGEPQGTAGLPVLDVLRRPGVTDAVLVVTRYFGGTLLGTGGLVRAYTRAAQEALASARVARMAPCDIFALRCAYADYDRLARLLDSLGAAVSASEFGADVSLTVALAQEKSERLCGEVRELTRGESVPKFLETRFEPIEYL